MRFSARVVACLIPLVVQSASALSQAFQPGQYEETSSGPTNSETETLTVSNISGGQQQIVIASHSTSIVDFSFIKCQITFDLQISAVFPADYNQRDPVKQNLDSCKLVPEPKCSGITGCGPGDVTLPPTRFFTRANKICIGNSSPEKCYSRSVK